MQRLSKPLPSTEIAQWVNAIHHGAVREITTVASLAAGHAQALGFVADHAHIAQAQNSEIGVLLVSELIAGDKTQIVVENVRVAWRLITDRLLAVEQGQRQPGIDPRAVIADSARIAASASIGAGAVIEAQAVIGEEVVIAPLVTIGRGVEIGAQTTIGSGARILTGTTIGRRCRILANAVIGERGFGNVFEQGRWQPLAQLGGVVIGDDVEVGAGTMIDRGALDNTVIGDGVKLDNLIQVAHNVVIGEHTAIAGCCVIAGSVRIGRYCVIGGASVINGHISICDGAQFAGHSSISKSITEPGMYCSVIPVMPAAKWKRFVAKLRLFGKEK